MAELLIVVAIIGVLSGVAFIAVQNHQRSLHQAEMDSVAKEIFVAAQNHLTMAKNENYLGVKGEGFGSVATGENGIYWLKPDISETTLMFNQILPFGSVDETVRAGGNYIIFYQPESGLVLDVFYTDDTGYSMNASTRDLRGESKRNNRRDVGIGWYGADEANGATIATGKWLKAPTIEVINAEKLMVKVNDNNTDTEEGYMLQLIISGLKLNGEENGAKKAITIATKALGALSDTDRTTGNGMYTVVLDDITESGMQFAKLGSETGTFVPGQDISIQAVAYNTQLITNVASSDVEITNSLFESISADDTGAVTASINNIRHLENLEEKVSGLTETLSDVAISIQDAVQTSDISWTSFKKNTQDAGTQIFGWESETSLTDEGCFLPVSPDYTISYDGKNYNVSDIKVSYAGDSGMFGLLKAGSVVKNLALLDFDITASSGNAGTLAGSMTSTTVTNVVAYNTSTGMTTSITGTGSVGGLIGSATSCTISKCAAALTVSSSEGPAGGLIGTSSGGTVTASYSGGHTDKAEYYIHGSDGTRNESIYNVTGGTYAGGLIGDAGNTEINQCYSTCSATGATVGGLVGTSSGAISNSYCTGLVKSTAATPIEGAFAGELGTEASATSCKYFEIINEIADTTNGGFKYLTAIGVDGENDNINITPFDKDAAAYDGFSWPGGATECPWKDANVYDKTLITYYGKTGTAERAARYNLQTVEQLGYTPVYSENQKDDSGNITAYADFVATHYGDWPAPEIFVINVPTTSTP